jgi:hypothetical protein
MIVLRLASLNHSGFWPLCSAGDKQGPGQETTIAITTVRVSVTTTLAASFALQVGIGCRFVNFKRGEQR